MRDRELDASSPLLASDASDLLSILDNLAHYKQHRPPPLVLLGVAIAAADVAVGVGVGVAVVCAMFVIPL